MTSAFSGRVDPEVAAVLAASTLDLSALSLTDLPRLRVRLDPPPPLDGVRRERHLLPGEAAPAVHVHSPAAAGPDRGCILWIHGGGYLMGSPYADAAQLDRWCLQLDCVVVSVDYRLAPEHPYPAALDDCEAALAWVFTQAGTLGIEPGRTGVAGSSAGAGLAAALALRARDTGSAAPAFQLLIAPMLDDRRGSPSAQWADAPVWARHANGVGWAAYLGGLADADVPPYAAAARAEDLTGLPPACILVGTADLFLDECIEQARRLAHAGVPTELHVYDGATHGFLSMAAETSVARRASRDVDDWLARQQSGGS
jgi:acetyl esterase/lipase